jgi:hypothetical protein
MLVNSAYSVEIAHLDCHVEAEIARAMCHVSDLVRAQVTQPESHPKKTLIRSQDMSFRVIRSLASMVNVVRKPR